MDHLARSVALHQRARALVDAFERGEEGESFDALARDIARFQADAVEGFARLCRKRSVDPRALTRASEIPPVPTDAFKLSLVSTFPAESSAAATFRTSGTTVGARGVHRFRDLATYERASIAFGRRWLVRDLSPPFPIVVLGPAPTEASDSSLVHMCSVFAKTFGDSSSEADTFMIQDGVIDLASFDTRVAVAITRNQPILVLGTSFAFVHFLDAIGDDSFALPPGSRVMQTGGFKGKSREVPADELRALLAAAFGIDARAIVAEYGMTELSSQFYERTLFDASARHGVYAEPPWARVVPVDPETLEEVSDGKVGIAKIVDLMNIDSAVAVLTQDRVRRVSQDEGGGFELLGRAPGAAPRGCSIAIDEMLDRSGES